MVPEIIILSIIIILGLFCFVYEVVIPKKEKPKKENKDENSDAKDEIYITPKVQREKASAERRQFFVTTGKAFIDANLKDICKIVEAYYCPGSSSPFTFDDLVRNFESLAALYLFHGAADEVFRYLYQCIKPLFYDAGYSVRWRDANFPYPACIIIY